MDLRNVFDLFSLLYVLRGIQIGIAVAGNWRKLQGKILQAGQKSIIEQASIFLAAPIGVLLHEGFHAVATWILGGQVLEFKYRVFWGYVTSDGQFTSYQAWFIALAGTLGSLLFGLLAWLAFRGNQAPSFRYFGLRAFRFQVHISLIYYPVFSFIGVFGDWQTIYDFAATPLLSSLAAGGHALILVSYFIAERRGAFQMMSFASGEERDGLATMEGEATANPEDMALQLKLIDEYRIGGEMNKAKARLRDLLKRYPTSAEGHLLQALTQIDGSGRISGKARDSAEKALSLGLSDPMGIAQANQLIGNYHLALGKMDEAMRYLDRAISAAETSGEPMPLAHATYLRAVAFRRKGQYQAAYQDIDRAILLAQRAGQKRIVAFYQQELETIKHHTGR